MILYIYEADAVLLQSLSDKGGCMDIPKPLAKAGYCDWGLRILSVQNPAVEVASLP